MTENPKQRTSTGFRIDKIERRSDGALEVNGYLTRTGVFEYERNGEQVRELRSDKEVFSEDTLDTMQGTFVTVDHPNDFLKVDSWRTEAVGVVTHVKAEPPYVAGKMRIWDSNAIHMVEKGYLKEVSCGYACVPVELTDSDEADVEQTQIRMNHAALGPEGWGRLGRDVSLRLDSNGQEVLEHFENGVNMEELEKALEPVLEAIQGLEEKYDALSTTLKEKAEAEAQAEEKEAEEKKDSPVQHHEEVPDPKSIAELVDSKAREIASLELRARDAHREIFPKATVSPELCGRQLCEEVIRTSDAKFISKDADELSGLVREAELVAWKQRNDRAESELSDRAGTAKRLREQLSAPVPAKALQTHKSALRERILG